jgi:hypothetical protein
MKMSFYVKMNTKERRKKLKMKEAGWKEEDDRIKYVKNTEGRLEE